MQKLLREQYGDQSVTVEKSGGDALLWFGRSSRQVTQEPDYAARLPGGRKKLYEFQIAEDSNIDHFDFKVSKVGKKIRGTRQPHRDREFFYVLRDRVKHAFFTPEWVLENGEFGFVPAWRVSAYRVPRGTFLSQFESGGDSLQQIIEVVKEKRVLLEFQERFLAKETERLAKKFQRVVDKKNIAQIVPDALEGFYEVCFLLDRLGREPSRPGVWLVYLASFFREDMTRLEFARFMYALDFIYFKCPPLLRNEIEKCQEVLGRAVKYVQRYANSSDGSFHASPTESAADATQRMVFGVNLLEDMIQDAIVQDGMQLESIKTIFQTIPNPRATAGVNLTWR